MLCGGRDACSCSFEQIQVSQGDQETKDVRLIKVEDSETVLELVRNCP